MRPYSPGGALNALASALKGSIPPTPSAHRLRLGLPGYLILFATLAFAPQRQYQAREPPSPLVFSTISTHFTATLSIPLSSPELKTASIERNLLVEPRVFTFDLTVACAPFTPSKSEQRSLPSYYRGCWHEVSRSFLWRYRQMNRLFIGPRSSPLTGVYTPKGFILHVASLPQTFVHWANF